MEESQEKLADDEPMGVIVGTTLSPVSQVIMKAVPVIGPGHSRERAPRVESVITLPPAKAATTSLPLANRIILPSPTNQTTSLQIPSQPSNPVPLLHSTLLTTQPVIVKSKGSIIVQHSSRGSVGVIRSLKAEQNKEYKSECVSPVTRDPENSNDSCSFVTNGSDNSMDSVSVVQGEKVDSWAASGASSEDSSVGKDFKGGEDSPSSNCSSLR